MPRAPNPLRETVVPLALLLGDTLVTFAGLVLGWWLRYASPVARLGIDVPDAILARYLPLLLVGVALLVAAFAQFGLYDARLLLRRYQILNAILKGTAFWLAAYLGVSLVLKFDPPISRLFALLAFSCVIVLLFAWRSLAYTVLTQPPFRDRLRRRAVLLGWNATARDLAADLTRDPAHPLALAGVIPLPTDPQCHLLDDTSKNSPRSSSDQCHLIDDTFNGPIPVPPGIAHLGSLTDLEAILTRVRADILIATRLDLPRDDLRCIVETCERRYVEWKIVPGAFDIFLSGLRLQTIGRIPVLGVEALALDRLFSRALKRTVDLLGATAGLVVSAPLILILAALIKRESPGGPVIFRQQRIGTGHRPFTLYKLRSMTPDAAATDAARQSTAPDDPRLLRLGAFLRRWNLDELPQFWNVLRGDMSLVGPRPERPHHVDQLARDIPHYLPRHLAKPGMTGWAQAHGLRGDSSLAARIQHDIYYIENWSIWLDVQIILLTFLRWRAPG